MAKSGSAPPRNPAMVVRCPARHAVAWVTVDRLFIGNPEKPRSAALREAGINAAAGRDAIVDVGFARDGELTRPGRLARAMGLVGHRVGCRCNAWVVTDDELLDALDARRRELVLSPRHAVNIGNERDQ